MIVYFLVGLSLFFNICCFVCIHFHNLALERINNTNKIQIDINDAFKRAIWPVEGRSTLQRHN